MQIEGTLLRSDFYLPSLSQRSHGELLFVRVERERESCFLLIDVKLCSAFSGGLYG